MKLNVGHHSGGPSPRHGRIRSWLHVLFAIVLATIGLSAFTAPLASADEGEPQRCLVTPAKDVVTNHAAKTHEEYRWSQEIPAVQEVSHLEYRFFRDVPKVDAVTHDEYQFSRTNPGSEEVSHQEYQFSRTNPGHAETFTTEYQYAKVIPAVVGIKECQYKKWVADTKTQYQYAKYTQTKTRTSEIWANFSPDDKHGTFEGPPSWPTDPAGTWHLHYSIPAGHNGPNGVYQTGGGNGDWFYRHGAGSWSDYGPWTLWSPLSHVSWEDFDQPSIGDPAFHADGSDNGTDWYRQWQVRNTGETRTVSSGGHWEYQWFTENPGDPWVKTNTCQWQVEPTPEQTIYYKDGAWTTDTPGEPWVKIDERKVSNNDKVDPFTEYRKTDGSASTDVADAAWFTESAFEGWTQFNSKTVVDKPEIPGYREYKTTDGTTLVLDEADWFVEVAFEGWSVLDSKTVVTQEFIPGYTIFYVEDGEPTLELGDVNWTTLDPGEPWYFVDQRTVTDKKAYSTTKTTPAVYDDCSSLAYTGFSTEGLMAGLGITGTGALLLVLAYRRQIMALLTKKAKA